MLLNAEAASGAAEIVREEEFYRHAHRKIFAAIVKVVTRKMAVDTVTVRNELTHAGALEEIGGHVYLAGLTDGLPKSVNWPHYAEIMRELKARRDLLIYSAKVANAVYGVEDAAMIRAQADDWLFDVSAPVKEEGLVSQNRAFQNFIGELDVRIQRKDDLLGYSTGLQALDDFTAGMVPDEVTVLAAATGGGKSAMALNISVAVAKAAGTVVYFSLEMTAQELQFRLAAIVSGVPAFKIRKGWVNDHEMNKIAVGLGRLTEIPLWYDEALEVSMRDIRAKVRTKKREAEAAGGKLGLIVIDYFQLLVPKEAANKKYEQRRDAMFADMSRGCKKLAREFTVPVLLLSQLSRGDKRERARRPVLSDLKETSALEQDASNVWFLYHENEHDGKVELIVAKARSGPTGTVDLMFEKDLLRFYDPKTSAAYLEPVQAPFKDT